jgi:hypothetical protein
VLYLKPVLEFLFYRHCIDQTVSCETNCCSADQEFPALYETRRFIALFTEQAIGHCKRLNKERVIVCEFAVGELRILRLFRNISFSTLSDGLKRPDVSVFLQHLNNINNFIKCKSCVNCNSAVGIATCYEMEGSGILTPVVGIATCYEMEGSGFLTPVVSRDFIFSTPIETGPGAHPASCTVGTKSLSGVYSGRVLLLTNHSHLAPRLNKELSCASTPLLRPKRHVIARL